MNERMKKPRFWIGAAWVVGFSALIELVVTPAYESAPAAVKCAILTVAAFSVAVLLAWLIRASLRD